MTFIGWGIGIRLAPLRRLGRSRSQQSTGLLLCAARPSNPKQQNKKAITADTVMTFIGWGIGIRTPTNRVRVCRATVTLFPNVTFMWATDIYYTQLKENVNTFFAKISDFFNFISCPFFYCKNRVFILKCI